MTTPTPNHSPASERQIIITRTFNAPRDLVWKMFTEPGHIKRWWGPKGFTTPVCEIDLRVGGIWHYVLRSPDGFEFAVDQIYHEIKAPERIVYGQSAATPESEETTHTLTFEQLDGQTKVTLISQFSTDAEYDETVRRGFAVGVGEGLDTLEEYLKTL